MTETAEPIRTAEPQIIADALQVIDSALGGFLHRELVSSGEITDVLLDVRTLLRRSDDAVGLAVASTKSDGAVARA
ncbi:hypothetical protein [Candidatus Poriferisodalis sp.]|uniref:hypothetical protein n=1 Tax=Candidatus Poriferisodalis sp. TaxID=3101277 RepID=UPI003B010247